MARRDRKVYMRGYMRQARARQRHFEEPRKVQPVIVLPFPQKPPQFSSPPSSPRVRQFPNFTVAEAAYWDRVNQAALDSVYGPSLPRPAPATMPPIEAPGGLLDASTLFFYVCGALLASWLLWKLLSGKSAPLPVVAEVPKFSAWFPGGI